MKKTNKKIAYVSGTRADFGLMMPILRAISQNKHLDLQVYATGMHLMPELGGTVNYLRKEFPNSLKINATFETDDWVGVAKFTGKFLNEVVKIFAKNRPDFVLTLGDRPEMLCVAMACLYLGIPTGQVHGGEKTSTIDEVARHAITKLSHVHFPATEKSAHRIEKMGEEKWRIHVVGAPALDTILNEKLLTRNELCKQLGLDWQKRYILVTQHSVSEEIEQVEAQIGETISAVKSFNLPVVIIYPNADPGGRKIIKIIEKEKRNTFFHIFPNLEYRQFLALEKWAAVWVGNSSGAMIESSSFRTPVVNIGTRQMGRQRGTNVIDTGYNRKEIEDAIDKSLNDLTYLKQLKKIKNPWGDGKTGPRVAKILESIIINSRLLTKQITY